MIERCIEAASQAHVIVSVGRPTATGPERALLEACDELFALERGELVVQGAPDQVFAPGARYRLAVVGGQFAEYSVQLVESGCRLCDVDDRGHYLVQLPAGGSTDLLLDAALDHGLVVLGLEPVFGAP